MKERAKFLIVFADEHHRTVSDRHEHVDAFGPNKLTQSGEKPFLIPVIAGQTDKPAYRAR
jgi:hypothetical protein